MPSKPKSNKTQKPNNSLWTCWLGNTSGPVTQVFRLGQLARVKPWVLALRVYTGCCHQHYCVGTDGGTSNTPPLGHFQASKGRFQFRNPVLDLWGPEKMRLVLLAGARPSHPLLPGWKSTGIPFSGSPRLQEPPSPGRRVRSVQLPALVEGFFLIWALDELRQQIHLCLTYALIFWFGRENKVQDAFKLDWCWKS